MSLVIQEQGSFQHILRYVYFSLFIRCTAVLVGRYDWKSQEMKS
ncbi:unnamed protein product [Kuraishia capsulata CBS 1993]|uniref:Uncharacterized protein n=1 Tax=Kuraishia capsulata CBS 1993 TaxID=1382522 RepID=W6MFU5_9ASCO|nr:uncharacterized protein KUCA_T00000771001 [Kuraishia capsulata CBS 1993]CDK24804.1 unnamed protein product [Kuraishia capsulata CBS 1993]